ncbi:hypothetical protein HMPREF2943_07545 [Corynebacterium sp. HMSC072D12]|uniref:ABC transporter permease n=1 Tax=Corynebacterium sp. HMSC072D12 TaxID=1739447 RepID=UPI0008BD1F5E|nr:ABC transporter permease [Corynebacterium sp. HMSC072D12]OFQ37365.1 hypothetical protein HMPREF2943_07545 [Corynebacterium sp. HMSC072D12]
MSSNPAKKLREMVLVDDRSLRRLDATNSLFKYLGALFNHRHFLVADARARSFSSGRNTFLGRSWLFLDPLFQVAIYSVVFGLVMQTDKGVENFVGFLAVGVTVFQAITRGYNSGSGVIQKSRALITSFHFPRIVVVMSRCLETWLNCSIPILVGIVCAIVFQKCDHIGWQLILVVPLYLLILGFSFGLACIFARLTAFIPDFKSLINVCTRGLFFVSGIFYSVDRFSGESVLLRVMTLNPVYQFLSAFRTIVLYGELPSLDSVLYLVIWTISLVGVGFVFFWRAEERYAYVK